MSSNGKVDRKALKSLGEERSARKAEEDADSAQGQEPRTESEVRLHKIWQDVLGREGTAISVFARFNSDLGGSSLAITRMRIAVEQAFGVPVPAPVVLERDHIVALAEWLDDKSGSKQDCPNVVCYQRSGSLPPFFCVAPVAGQVLCYKALADVMDPEQPFYALQSFGLNDGETAMTSIEAMAAGLLEQVAAVLQRFPRHQRRFHLGGWSMGGVVAFEMWLQIARRASESNMQTPLEVGQLVMLDSPAPYGTMPTFTEAEMLLTFAADLTSCRESFDLPEVDSLAALANRRDIVLSKLEHKVVRKDLERTFDVYCANLLALSAYRPALQGAEANGLRLHLVKASETNEHLRKYPGHEAIDLGWTQTGLRASQILLYTQGGDHYFVTESDQLPAIARRLIRILDETDSRVASGQAAYEAVMVVESSSRTSSRTLARPPSGVAASSSPLGSAPTILHAGIQPTLRGPISPLAKMTAGRGRGFRSASSCSSMTDWDRAVLDAYTDLLKRLRAEPTLLLVSCTATFPAALVASLLSRLCPSAVIHGTSSCKGCITSDGHHTFGLLGIVDPVGRYSVGFSKGATSAETAKEAGRRAAKAALDAVRVTPYRKRSTPAVALINAAPLCEELVLAGIEEVLGSDVPIIGGSSADEALDGRWWSLAVMPRDNEVVSAYDPGEMSLLGYELSASDGVVITLMWPSVKTKLVMSSAFGPTAARGVVTRAEGRVIHEIDGKRAAHVYAEWSASQGYKAKLQQMEANGQAQGVLSETTLAPLGRERALSAPGYATGSSRAPVPVVPVPVPVPVDGGGRGSRRSSWEDRGKFYSLVHPARVLPSGGLECFADCLEGETLVLMAAQQGLETLVHHPTNVMQSAGIDNLKSCLVVYCAGCAIAIEERLQDVAKSFADSLGGGSVDGDGGGLPFLGMFTYGEQCRTPSGGNQHVNLMYAVLAFCED